jgi:hypothetical protein
LINELDALNVSVLSSVRVARQGDDDARGLHAVLLGIYQSLSDSGWVRPERGAESETEYAGAVLNALSQRLQANLSSCYQLAEAVRGFDRAMGAEGPSAGAGLGILGTMLRDLGEGGCSPSEGLGALFTRVRRLCDVLGVDPAEVSLPSASRGDSLLSRLASLEESAQSTRNEFSSFSEKETEARESLKAQMAESAQTTRDEFAAFSKKESGARESLQAQMAESARLEESRRTHLMDLLRRELGESGLAEENPSPLFDRVAALEDKASSFSSSLDPITRELANLVQSVSAHTDDLASIHDAARGAKSELEGAVNRIVDLERRFSGSATVQSGVD